MKNLFLAIGALGALAAWSFVTPFHYASNEGIKQKLETLSGTYEDAVPYAYGKAYGKRIFTFNKGKWTLDFVLGLDPELKMNVFRFRTKGYYKVLNQSTTVPQAFNAIFYEDTKWLTLLTSDQQIAQAFGLANCGLQTNIEKDISQTGCSLWKPVSVCNEDHDLLSLDKNGLLYFGVRPQDNDMCNPSKRPTALTPPVTKK
jgi:hypothetical protein